MSSATVQLTMKLFFVFVIGKQKYYNDSIIGASNTNTHTRLASHTNTHTHTHRLSYKYTYTHARTHTHTHAHTHAHTRTLEYDITNATTHNSKSRNVCQNSGVCSEGPWEKGPRARVPPNAVNEQLRGRCRGSQELQRLCAIC
jgi:hypothetical protein